MIYGEGNGVWEFPVFRILEETEQREEEEIKKKKKDFNCITTIQILGDAMRLSSF